MFLSSCATLQTTLIGEHRMSSPCWWKPLFGRYRDDGTCVYDNHNNVCADIPVTLFLVFKVVYTLVLHANVVVCNFLETTGFALFPENYQRRRLLDKTDK